MRNGWWVACLVAACGGGEPAAQPAAPAGASSGVATANRDAWKVTMAAFGPLRADTPPTLVGLKKAVGSDYEVRPAQGAVAGATFQVLKAGEVVADVVPNVSGTGIKRVLSRSERVVFPWDTRVSSRLGTHRNWDRMSCRLGEIPGSAFCHPFQDAVFGLLVPVTGALPDKAALAEASVSGLVWTPIPASKRAGKAAAPP
jgi:hypothetical protein